MKTTKGQWPFKETPGELASRVESALRDFGAVLPALRNVFIEQGVEILDEQGLEAEKRRTAESLAKFWRDTWHRTVSQLPHYTTEDRTKALCLMTDCVIKYKALTGRELNPIPTGEEQ
jgi:hypothetical protein